MQKILQKPVLRFAREKIYILRVISFDYIIEAGRERIARLCIERKQKLKSYKKETMLLPLLIYPVFFYLLVKGLS